MANGFKAAPTRKRNLEAKKAAAAAAEVPLIHQVALSLKRIEARLGEPAKYSEPHYAPPEKEFERLKLSQVDAAPYPQGNVAEVTESVPSVAALAQSVHQRSAYLRQRMEELLATLVYGGNAAAPQDGTDRKSEGPTKDALMGTHGNFNDMESFLDRISTYLLA